MKLRRASVVAAAVAFVQSPQGQQMIARARDRFDTPDNRAKLRQTAEQLRATVAARSGRVNQRRY
ncbi:MAG: hypothetical protein M3Z02_01360 [Actinomycetota bacterium]|nr:hypothetical protein [Actinomycetota bacterium]